MNKLVLFSVLLVAFSFASAGEVIKTCKITMKIGSSKVVPTTFEIIKEGETLIAKTTQIADGQTGVLPIENVSVADFSVRENLTSQSPNLNSAELLIAGTADLLVTPDFGSQFSIGLDISKIRFARVYKVGKFTHMGGTVIIEAQDGEKNNLGSFVTGFLPFACEK